MTEHKISEQEMQQIREEAAANATEKCIGYAEVGCSEIRQREINAYVAAAVKHITAERERVKGLVEVLEWTLKIIQPYTPHQIREIKMRMKETLNNYKNNK